MIQSEEMLTALSKAIAAELPEAIIEGLVGHAIKSTLHSLQYQTSDIQKLVSDVIVARAKELLKTKYAAEVDKQADVLAARMVGEMASFGPRSR